MDAFYPKLLCVFLLSINVVMFIASAYLNYNLSDGETIFQGLHSIGFSVWMIYSSNILILHWSLDLSSNALWSDLSSITAEVT